MGDRANLVVETRPNGNVYFYTHWGGGALPATLQVALRKGWRWDDPSYLARIIFCEMLNQGDDEETGFGIDTAKAHVEHPILHVRPNAQRVELYEDDVLGTPLRTWTFKQFCEINSPTWENLGG